MSDNSLFSTVQLGAIELANRIVMAPMTRSRANNDGTANDLMRQYYQQRATAGLIISEGTQPSENGKGYCRTPGIHSGEQIKAWQGVTSAVSDRGGAMVMQVMHCGRIASAHNKAAGSETVAPSAIQAKGQMFTDAVGMADFDMPRALTKDEIGDVINEYAVAADNAIKAGFAGVELHCTSGYLPAQFLSTGTNARTDEYGGSLQNRLRFVLEVLQAMGAAVGMDRVGIRICPGNPFNDLHDDNPSETFAALLREIDSYGLAYLHTIRMVNKNSGMDTIELSKANFSGPLIVNDSYSFDEASDVINSGVAEAVSFGRYFIANPDLVSRFEHGVALSDFNPKTLYLAGAEGYTDYK